MSGTGGLRGRELFGMPQTIREFSDVDQGRALQAGGRWAKKNHKHIEAVTLWFDSDESVYYVFLHHDA